MFEQAVLPSGPGGRRYWTVIVGFTGEFILLAGVLVAPLIWPQLLPQARTFVPGEEIRDHAHIGNSLIIGL